MASKSYTLLEYLVTIETELKKLKKIVAESVGADYSELIANIDEIRNELNTFKTTITDTVNTNNSEITSKFNSLEQQFNTFKTSITNTVNSNKSEITSQVNTLTTNFNSFKTSLESQVSGLTTRVTNVENRVTTLENSGGSSGGTVDLTEVNSRISVNENNIKTLQSDVTSLKGRVSSLENNSGSSGGSSGVADGYGKKLIASYTHTSNKVVQPTAFNPETGVFTCPDHGLTGNEKLMINFNSLDFTTITVIPYELFLKFDSTTWDNFKPVIIDNNSFSLDGYSIFDTSKTDSIDVTKFWFETIGTENITFNNLNLEGIKELEIVTTNSRCCTYGLCLDCLNNSIVSPYRMQQVMNKIDLIPFGTEHIFSPRGINLSNQTVTTIKNGYVYTTNTKTYIPIESGKYADSWNTNNAHFSFLQLIKGALSFKNTFKLDVGTRQNIRNGVKIEIYDLGAR